MKGFIDIHSLSLKIYLHQSEANYESANQQEQNLPFTFTN